jgi:xanthine dehydrogenase accessory factor
MESSPLTDIFTAIEGALTSGDPVVLITVVRTSGSTPQKPGAKLLVREDGSTVGTLGGGCVENDLRSFALDALRTGRPAHLRDYVLNESPASSRGMACGGRMTFFVDPIRKPDFHLAPVSEILGTQSGSSAVAMCSLIRAYGDEAGFVGRTLLVREIGTQAGSLGKPQWDAHAIAASREILQEKGAPRCVLLGQGVEYFLEAYFPPPLLVVLGGGHIAKALEPLAKSAGLRFSVVDDRPEYASRERFSAAEDILPTEFGKGLRSLSTREDDFIVVATRGHRFDDEALEAAARSRARYVGLLGSRRKVALIFASLMLKGIPRERVEGIHAPIGLDIGGISPEEIAISIIAEIVMCRRGGTGQPMKSRDPKG